MKNSKASKIFIKNGNITNVFMWAILATDGSVIMGFPWESNEALTLLMDENLGKLRPEDLIAEEYKGKSKISFHASGHFKLNSRVGINETSIDRVTVIGSPLNEIDSPQTMAEILLPKEIPYSSNIPTNRDIVIDITDAETLPTRCTISCMSNKKFSEISKIKHRFVGTSLWEASHALENDTHTWVWTFRRSQDDKNFTDKIYVTLIGGIKWGIDSANLNID